MTSPPPRCVCVQRLQPAHTKTEKAAKISGHSKICEIKLNSLYGILSQCEFTISNKAACSALLKLLWKKHFSVFSMRFLPEN